MILLSSVTEIEPKYIDARIEQSANHLDIIGSWAQGGDYLCVAMTAHNIVLIRLSGLILSALIRCF